MDDLGYGLDNPQLALQQDGNVFITGTQITDAPTAQAAMVGNGKLKTASRGMNAAAAAASSTTTATTFFGQMAIQLGRAAYPEEAALSKSTVADLTVTGLPKRAVISIPLPSDGDTTSGTDELWLGTNQRQRYFLVQFMKPIPPGPYSNDQFEVTGIRVTLDALNGWGGVEQSQVVLGQDTPQPLQSGVFEQIRTRSDIGYVEPAFPITSSYERRQEIDREHLRKQWTQNWLPAKDLGVYSPSLYYRVRVTGDGTIPSNIRYGLMGGNVVSPPGGNLQYTFRIYYRRNGQVTFTDVNTPIWTTIEPRWSAAQFFRTRWFGDWNSDKWATKQTFDWLALLPNRSLLDPLNDISLEHGRNTGHSEHLSGEQMDTFHPARGTLVPGIANSYGTALWGSGFRDGELRYRLQLARGDSDWADPQPTQGARDQATRELAAWVMAARAEILGVMTQTPVTTPSTFGPNDFIYMARTDVANQFNVGEVFQPDSSKNKTSNDVRTDMEITRDGIQLRDLLLKGACTAFSLGPASGYVGGVIIRNGLNLTNNTAIPDPAARPQSWSVNPNKFSGDKGKVHTDHLHLNFALKSTQFPL